MKILFLCTGNSCRSQIAEGWARHLKPDVIEAFSAGTEPTELDPLAVKVMAEKGVDISGYRAKNVNEFRNVKFDYVVTVCSNASKKCPLFTARTKIIHCGFDDPPRLAKSLKTDEEKLKIYCKVRDEIRRFIETLPESLIKS